MAMSKRVLPFVVYFPLSINDLGMLQGGCSCVIANRRSPRSLLPVRASLRPAHPPVHPPVSPKQTSLSARSRLATLPVRDLLGCLEALFPDTLPRTPSLPHPEVAALIGEQRVLDLLRQVVKEQEGTR